MAATRYGLIGCGMMGQEHLRNIALLPGVEVAAIFEPDPGMHDIARRLTLRQQGGPPRAGPQAPGALTRLQLHIFEHSTLIQKC